METWRAGDTSVERLSWSSAWIARVDGCWVEGKEDEGGGLPCDMAFIPFGATEGGMVVVFQDSIAMKWVYIIYGVMRFR